MGELVHEAMGVRYRVRPDAYDPSDDTFLLARAVLSRPRGRLLEVGTGSGFVAIAAAKAGFTVTATEIHGAALSLAQENAVLNDVTIRFVLCDLASGLRAALFNLVVFNPPYLPTGADERLPGAINAAFDGGPDGLAAERRFLAALPPGPDVILIRSSVQARAVDPTPVEVLGRSRHFQETLEAVLLNDRARVAARGAQPL